MAEKEQNSVEAYLDASIAPDSLTELPDEVQAKLDAHRELYMRDPEGAHIWDPIVIGVPYGPVKCLLLTYTGRKSGRTLRTVLQYYVLGGKVAIVASRGGTAEPPAWYLNLVDEPKCHIQVGKDGRDAVARTLTSEERAKWWPQILEEQPIQADYQKRTTREIAVVVFD